MKRLQAKLADKALSHKKAQKKSIISSVLLCAFCAFLWLNFTSALSR
jgi:hypothetical protein